MKHTAARIKNLFKSATSNKKPVEVKDIIVFSHLRWEFVKQRPQHILERLAKGRKILFVEEPIEGGELGSSHKIVINEQITVLQPYMNHQDWNTLEAIVRDEIDNSNLEPSVLWFYSPSFVEMASRVESDIVIYDCMDQLSAFKGAPPELLNQEIQLLNIADAVFTGGKSLYEEKKKYHHNVFCFPSSVDRKHFEKSTKNSTRIPSDIENINSPIVGFYGVIDERIDLTLLEDVAQKMPTVSFVMIGPVVKIQESELPQAHNLYYLGNRSYDELPSYLKAFHVAMMPFALNASTKFISPTKTLEFMAAHKPIVSTPITDVKRDYEREVHIASTVEEFVEGIERYLSETPIQKSFREALQTAVINATSWDITAESMFTIIQDNIDSRTQVNSSPIENNRYSDVNALSTV